MRLSNKETDIVRVCLDWLALHRIKAWRTNNTGIFDPVKKVLADRPFLVISRISGEPRPFREKGQFFKLFLSGRMLVEQRQNGRIGPLFGQFQRRLPGS